MKTKKQLYRFVDGIVRSVQTLQSLEDGIEVGDGTDDGTEDTARFVVGRKLRKMQRKLVADACDLDLEDEEDAATVKEHIEMATAWIESKEEDRKERRKANKAAKEAGEAGDDADADDE